MTEWLINSFCGERSEHHRVRLVDAEGIRGHDVNAINYRAIEDFFLDSFLRHRWHCGNHKLDKNSLLQAWNAFIHNVENIGREAWLQKLDETRVKFEESTSTGATLSYIGCPVSDEYHAPRRDTRVRVVLTTHNVLIEMCIV